MVETNNNNVDSVSSNHINTEIDERSTVSRGGLEIDQFRSLLKNLMGKITVSGHNLLN